MDTVELKGYGFGGVYRGTHYGSVGVYTHKDGHTYAGERNEGGKAQGEGVLTCSDGTTVSGQRADGHWHGHREEHRANGEVYYGLWERGNWVHFARVRPDGDCEYDCKRCGADRADFVALKNAAQQAGVRMPPTRIQRNARARRPNPRRTRRFGFRTALGFGAWRRPAALGVRVQVCACVYVRASVCACPCACVYLCVRVRARSCVRGCV
jgi:hypothetical protein